MDTNSRRRTNVRSAAGRVARSDRAAAASPDLTALAAPQLPSCPDGSSGAAAPTAARSCHRGSWQLG